MSVKERYSDSGCTFTHTGAHNARTVRILHLQESFVNP
jgi:hypothetical protein